MEFEHILVQRSGDFATVTMNRPQRRNAMNQAMWQQLPLLVEEATTTLFVGPGDTLRVAATGDYLIELGRK